MKRFLGIIALLAAFQAVPSCNKGKEPVDQPLKGVVLTVNDLSDPAWPSRIAAAGLNTVGTHINPSQVMAFLETDRGRAFLHECDSLGIMVEHQLHSMGELLPRGLFDTDSTMFRMDSDGRRNPDSNCCVSSQKALETVASNAAAFARILVPGNHRYYFWLDDGAPTCECPSCADLSPSEQALILENAMIDSIRTVDPAAKLAHLAYANTIIPPVKVTPSDGVFLEFAPIYRSWDVPLTDTAAVCPRGVQVTNGDNLNYLKANLEVFPAEETVILEYWLDVSLFSRWTLPAVELPWKEAVCRSDVETYRSLGIKNFTSFAVYMDSAYFQKYPVASKALEEYGRILSEVK